MAVFEFDDGAGNIAYTSQTRMVIEETSPVAFTFNISKPAIFSAFWRPGRDDTDGGQGTIDIINSATQQMATFEMTYTDGGGNDQLVDPSVKFGAIGGDIVVRAFNDVGGTTQTQTLTGNQDGGAVSFSGQISKITFTASPVSNFVLNSVSGDIACFLEHTKIATETGARAVQDLAPGDILTLANGQKTRVTWVGHRFVPTEFVNPDEQYPICIAAHALDDQVPSRDLYVSPDHALFLDGILVNAAALVNGSSIYQVETMPAEGFTYYHVETEAHDVILAENTPVETFVDYVDPSVFENANERDARFIKEMDVPRVCASRLLPPSIARRLHDRAHSIGLLVSPAA